MYEESFFYQDLCNFVRGFRILEDFTLFSFLQLVSQKVISILVDLLYLRIVNTMNLI